MNRQAAAARGLQCDINCQAGERPPGRPAGRSVPAAMCHRNFDRLAGGWSGGVWRALLGNLYGTLSCWRAWLGNSYGIICCVQVSVALL